LCSIRVEEDSVQNIDEIRDRLEVAIDVAREAGKIAIEFFHKAERGLLEVTAKGIQDYVTLADRKVEEYIRRLLEQAFPNDGFWGEENTGREETQGLWVVDPIDGTGNFIRGIDIWCISIAYQFNYETQLGVVFEPVRDRLYSARLGHGAFSNGQPIKVSKDVAHQNSMMILGHSFRRPMGTHIEAINHLNNQLIDYRLFGAAALGLAYVAAGKAEAFFEAHLNSWDALAGLLIVEEAGGRCSTFSGRDTLIHGGPVLACTASLWPITKSLLSMSQDVEK